MTAEKATRAEEDKTDKAAHGYKYTQHKPTTNTQTYTHTYKQAIPRHNTIESLTQCNAIGLASNHKTLSRSLTLLCSLPPSLFLPPFAINFLSFRFMCVANGGAAITQKASLITADKLSVLVADWKRATKLNYE